jgi:hypothetical protein
VKRIIFAFAGLCAMSIGGSLGLLSAQQPQPVAAKPGVLLVQSKRSYWCWSAEYRSGLRDRL